MQWGGQVRGFKRELSMQIELQWQTQEILTDIASHHFDEAQRFSIATEQQMLSVVQLCVVVFHTACATTELFGTLEYRDRDTAGGKFDSGGHAGIATADDADCQFLSQVLNASQSLRSGVSETRSFRTWQPLVMTSFSVAR